MKWCDRKPVTEPGAAASVAAAAGGDGSGGGGNDEDVPDGKTNRVYTCARCYQEFRDAARYQQHCNKCRDD